MKIKNKVFLTTIACLTTYFTQSMEQQDNVKLESSDEQQFQVPINFAEKSETIKDLVKELEEIVDPTESIHLQNVSGEVLGFILDLLGKDLKNEELISGIKEKILELSQSNPTFGYQFLAAINYLNISDLLPIAINCVGQLMKTQIKEGKKDILKDGLELIPHNLENQIKEIVISEYISCLEIRGGPDCNTPKIISVGFCLDGSIIIGFQRGQIKMFNIDGSLGYCFDTHNHEGGFSVEFSPNGKYILTGDYKKQTAKLWDWTGSRIKIFKETDSLNSAVFSPDGKYILITSGSTAKLWSIEYIRTFQCYDIAHVRTFHFPDTTYVLLAVLSSDGKYILTVSNDNTVRLWNLTDLNETKSIVLHGHTDGITSIAFSPYGRFALTGSYDNTAILWDLSNLNNITSKVLRGHKRLVYSVAFSPDGKYILTGSADNTAKLWDMNGNLIYTFTGHIDIITSVAFSPDGKYILTGSEDCTAILWDISFLAFNLKTIVFILLIESLKNKGELKELFADPYWKNICINLPDSVQQKLKNYLKCKLV